MPFFFSSNTIHLSKTRGIMFYSSNQLFSNSYLSKKLAKENWSLSMQALHLLLKMHMPSASPAQTMLHFLSTFFKGKTQDDAAFTPLLPLPNKFRHLTAHCHLRSQARTWLKNEPDDMAGPKVMGISQLIVLIVSHQLLWSYLVACQPAPT